MRKRILIVSGMILAIVAVQNCSSNPEQALLSRYFNAVSMNDNATMATMALEPAQWDVASWQIVSVTPEKVEPVTLPGLSQKESEAKKAQDAQVGPTMDADTVLANAKDELDLARTAAARAAAKKKVDEAQAKYDQEFGKMRDLKKAYNDAKAAAAAEEQMTLFSVGVRELAGIRDLTGNIRSKEVVVKIKTKQGVAKDYRLPMRMYQLQTAGGQRLTPRWIIIKFEAVG